MLTNDHKALVTLNIEFKNRISTTDHPHLDHPFSSLLITGNRFKINQGTNV